jgi:hypothetical protein
MNYIIPGPRGLIGPPGPPGFSGATGFTGASGFIGANGMTGFTGSSGLNGSIGFIGATGVGATGFGGSSGFNGSTGFQGATGLGATGFSGSSGFIGSSGLTGSSGFSGSTGFVGATGLGATGFSGSTGFVGATGLGATGFGGSSGFIGSSGLIGASGFNGSTGFIGATGLGATGFGGSSGFNGSTGFVGATGFNGSSGFIGSSGLIGASGFIGSTGFGATGFTGASGPMGFQGASGAGSSGLGVITSNDYYATGFRTYFTGGTVATATGISSYAIAYDATNNNAYVTNGLVFHAQNSIFQNGAYVGPLDGDSTQAITIVPSTSTIFTGSYNFSNIYVFTNNNPFPVATPAFNQPDTEHAYAMATNNTTSPATIYIVAAANGSNAKLYMVSNVSPYTITLIVTSLGYVPYMLENGSVICTSIVYNPLGNNLYISDRNLTTSILLVDAASHTFTTLTMGSNDVGPMAINTITNRLYVLGTSPNVVTVVNTTTNVIITTISLPTTPYYIDIDTTNNILYVSSAQDGSVYVLDAITNFSVPITTLTFPVSQVTMAFSTGGLYSVQLASNIVNYTTNTQSIPELIQSNSFATLVTYQYKNIYTAGQTYNFALYPTPLPTGAVPGYVEFFSFIQSGQNVMFSDLTATNTGTALVITGTAVNNVTVPVGPLVFLVDYV